MSFLTAERSESSSKPVELYKFTDFRYNNYFFTSSDKSVSFGADIYVPFFIKRSSIKQSSTFEKNDITVTITKNNPIVEQLFNTIYPKTSVTLTIYRYQIEENDFVQIFNGVVVDPKFIDSKRIELTCQNVTRDSFRSTNRYNFQYNCNHSQYSNSCKLSIFKHSQTIKVENILDNGRKIISSQIGEKDDDYYRSGMSYTKPILGLDVESYSLEDVRKTVDEYQDLNIDLEFIRDGVSIASKTDDFIYNVSYAIKNTTFTYVFIDVFTKSSLKFVRRDYYNGLNGIKITSVEEFDNYIVFSRNSSNFLIYDKRNGSFFIDNASKADDTANYNITAMIYIKTAGVLVCFGKGNTGGSNFIVIYDKNFKVLLVHVIQGLFSSSAIINRVQKDSSDMRIFFDYRQFNQNHPQTGSIYFFYINLVTLTVHTVNSLYNIVPEKIVYSGYNSEDVFNNHFVIDQKNDNCYYFDAVDPLGDTNFYHYKIQDKYSNLIGSTDGLLTRIYCRLDDINRSSVFKMNRTKIFNNCVIINNFNRRVSGESDIQGLGGSSFRIFNNQTGLIESLYSFYNLAIPYTSSNSFQFVDYDKFYKEAYCLTIYERTSPDYLYKTKMEVVVPIFSDTKDMGVYGNFDSSNEFRQIISHGTDVDGNYIMLDNEYNNLQIGDIIYLAYGCKSSRTGCKLVNNFDNYMGFEFVPTFNPHERELV